MQIIVPKWFRLLVFTVAAISRLSANSVALAKGKAEKASKSVSVESGQVSAVDGDSITVETKKKGAHQFKITAETTFILKDKKGGSEKPAALSDVKDGQKVQVTTKDAKVSQVVIESKPEKKGKKNKAA